jgi:hypothetical protein
MSTPPGPPAPGSPEYYPQPPVAPQYEQQGAPGYGQQPPPGTNGFSIAALIFGIIGGFLLGFIFGFIALSKTKKTGQAGRGMAIAGIVLSAVWTVIWAVIIIFAVSAVKTVLSSSGAPGYGLNPGDCFNQNPSSLSQVDKTSCTTPHDGEAVALIPITGTTFPGDTVIQRQATAQCPDPAKSFGRLQTELELPGPEPARLERGQPHDRLLRRQHGRQADRPSAALTTARVGLPHPRATRMREALTEHCRQAQTSRSDRLDLGHHFLPDRGLLT